MTGVKRRSLGGAVVLGRRASRFVFVPGTLILLGGCQNVGPIAIDQGRDRYNNIIQSTSKEQTLSNIIRVHNHEPTSFMDVTEVDATTTFSGTISGTVSNIGAKAGASGGTLAGQTGGIASGVTYSEAPLIRYQPLLGQPLVQQLATPVSLEALGSLYDSHWRVMPLLDFAALYMTLIPRQSYAALNIIAELDTKNVLELVAEQSEVTKSNDSTAIGTLKQSKAGNVILQVTNKATGTGTKDALVIYLLPSDPDATPRDKAREIRLWLRLWCLYEGTQPTPKYQKGAKCPQNMRYADLDQAKNRVPRSIEVRTMPVAPDKVPNGIGAPLMRTYSALGMLRQATERQHPRIEFVSPYYYDRITSTSSSPWNKKAYNANFYMLLPETEHELNEGDKDPTIDPEITNWITRTGNPGDDLLLYDPPKISVGDFIRGNRRLGQLRRYILIIKADHAPANAYVAHFDHGEWYYIDGSDYTSQKNFGLISLFMTMMAVPPTTPPLSPTISVGGT